MTRLAVKCRIGGRLRLMTSFTISHQPTKGLAVSDGAKKLTLSQRLTEGESPEGACIIERWTFMRVVPMSSTEYIITGQGQMHAIFHHRLGAYSATQGSPPPAGSSSSLPSQPKSIA